MAGIFGNRVVKQARIEGEGIAVDAVVKHGSIRFKAAGLGAVRDEEFGLFRDIVVEDNSAKCAVSFFSPYRLIKLGNATIQEIMKSVEDGDILRSYTVVLDGIYVSMSGEIMFNPYTNKRDEIEHHLSLLSRIKQRVSNARVIEDPRVILKKMESVAESIMA